VTEERDEAGHADECDGGEQQSRPSNRPRWLEPRVQQQRQGLGGEDREGDQRMGGRTGVDRQEADPDGAQPGHHPEPAHQGLAPAIPEPGEGADRLQHPEEDEDDVHGQGRRRAADLTGVAGRAEGADRVVPEGVADAGRDGQPGLGGEVGRLRQPRGIPEGPAGPFRRSHTVTLAPVWLGRLAP
jgi:hypothetical protein